MGVVVIGAIFVDIKGYPSEVYIPGGRNAGRVEQVHGGVSRNIAEDIANVELRPTFISLVDDTGVGADVIKKLNAHKVNTDYIRVTPDGMGTWLANMRIAFERRDFLRSTQCFVCNQQEAGILFSDDYDDKTPAEMADILSRRIKAAQIPRMVVTMGEQGAVYATMDGESGVCPAKHVDVKDTTGAGDAFFSGTVIGLTYGKNIAEACEIGTRLAASVICTSENVCPRFLPEEFGLDVNISD